MPETKIVSQLYVVTDTETGQEEVGDIQGGIFIHGWLEDHIDKYGHERILLLLAMQQSEVIEAWRSVNRKKYAEQNNSIVAVSS